jgi:hypothetical protein
VAPGLNICGVVELNTKQPKIFALALPLVIATVFGLVVAGPWATAAAGGPKGRPLTFKAWKAHHVLEARNRRVRAANRLVLIKRSPTNDLDAIQSMELDVARAQKGVTFAKNLNLEDYLSIYIRPLGLGPVGLRAAAAQLSRDEVAEVVRLFVEDPPPKTAHSLATSF